MGAKMAPREQNNGPAKICGKPKAARKLESLFKVYCDLNVQLKQIKQNTSKCFRSFKYLSQNPLEQMLTCMGEWKRHFLEFRLISSVGNP